MVKSDCVWILVSSFTGWMIWGSLLNLSVSKPAFVTWEWLQCVDLQYCGESLISWWSPYLAQCPAHPKHSVRVDSSCIIDDELSHTLPCRIDGQHNSRGCHRIEPNVVNKDSAVELCKRPLVPTYRQPSFFTVMHSWECAPESCAIPTETWVCKSASYSEPCLSHSPALCCPCWSFYATCTGHLLIN